MVVAPLAGSPAEKAGVLAGDLILAVDGITLDGLTVDARARPDPWPEGLGRHPDRGARWWRAVRPRDHPRCHRAGGGRQPRTEADGSIGYVRLNGFSDRGAEEVETALREHVAAGRERLILDLRGNPGGYVTAARSVASQFIGSGPVFWEQDADGRPATRPRPSPAGPPPTRPSRSWSWSTAGSASASEIVAGALQDTGRGTLVGEQTFGKGTVQQWNELTGEGGAFRLTIARWLTPDKRWIHDVGIDPGRAPSRSRPTLGPDDDPVLDRALELLSGAGARAEPRIAAA